MRRLILILLLITSSCYSWAMANTPSGLNQADGNIGNLAPEFKLENASGNYQTLTEARAGKKSILFFWATWCPHCHEELERMRQNLQTIQQAGVQVILVNSGDDKEKVKRFLSRNDIPIDSFLDEDNTISGLYGVVGIPMIFLIDEKGIIRSIRNEFPIDPQSAFNSL